MNVEQRLEQLERANRRMKRLGAFVLLTAAIVLLSGQANGKALPDLEVRSLTLKDKEGKTRATLSVLAHGASLNLFDKGGKMRVWLSTMADGSVALALLDKDGTTRMALGVAAKGPALAFSDKEGKVRVGLSVDADGAVLRLADKDGNPRATLGVPTTVNKRTGAETETTAGTLTLFDAKGDVLWQAPR